MEKFREELLRTDIIPRKLNDVSKKYRELFLKDIESGKIKTEEVTKCQCGSTNLEQLTKIDRFGLPFGSLICKDCGLVITSPRIAEESLPYYYDKYYHPLNFGREDTENQEALFAKGQGKKIFNILKNYLPNKNKLDVLEIGAGTGNVLYELKEEAKKYNIDINEIGTEYNFKCIEICNKKGIRTIYGGLKEAKNEAKSFDIIILSHVFEHFVNLEHELLNIKDLMHKDSLLYIEVPGILSSHKKEYYDFSFVGYLTHAHMYNFVQDTLSNIFTNNGFKIVYINEEVESVFKLDSIGQIIKKSNSYNLIIEYLDKFYSSYSFLEDAIEAKLTKLYTQLDKYEAMLKNRDKDIIKYKQMIENRDKDIIKYKQMIENRDKDIIKYKQMIENRDKDIIKYKQMIENRDKIIRDIKIVIDKKNTYFNILKNKKNLEKIKSILGV